MPGCRTLVALSFLSVSLLSVPVPAQTPVLPDVLPAPAVEQLAKSLELAERHREHVWRDTALFNADGTINGYVEIPRGERRKWEFDMRANALEIDRIIPEAAGGYPVNYGFVPQTVSVDGDPFDVLVLGPPLAGGTLVRGAIVGVLWMEDDKGPDSKLVVSPVGADGRPLHALTSEVRDSVGRYFDTYKSFEPGKFSRVHGWGSAEEGRAFAERTHAFFRECRTATEGPCRVRR